MKRAVTQGSPWAIVGLAFLALWSACDKSDQLRATLEADQAVWTKRVAALKGRASDLRQKVDALPPQPVTSPVAQVAQRQQVEALAIDAGQSLYDLERAIADGVRDVEAAIAIGDGRAEGTLTAVANNLDRLVNQQEQGVVAVELALNQLEGAR